MTVADLRHVGTAEKTIRPPAGPRLVISGAAGPNAVDADAREFVLGVRRALYGLDPAARHVVRLAAVLDRPWAVEEALELLPEMSAELVAAGVEAAAGSGLLTDTGDRIAFGHPHARRVVYAGLADHTRRDLQRRCAIYLAVAEGPAGAAVPFARGAATPGDVTLALLLLDAAEETAAANPVAAGDLATEAFGLLRPAQPEWAPAARRCLDILVRAQRDDAVRIADLLLARVDDVVARARLQSIAARALVLAGRPAAAADRLDRAAALLAGDLPPSAVLKATRALVATRLDPAGGRPAHVNLVLDAVRAAGDERAVRTALQAAGESARIAGEHAAALAHFRELRIRSGEDHLAAEIRALQLVDRHADSEVILASIPASARPSLLHVMAWQDYDLARFDSAEESAHAVAARGDDLSLRRGHGMLSAIALHRGLPGRAREELAQADPYGTGAEHDQGITILHGLVDLAAGRLDQARRRFEPLLFTAGDTLSDWPWRPGLMRTLALLGRDLGDSRFAAEAAALAAEGARRNPGVASFAGLALQCRAVLERDPIRAGEAAELLAAGPRPLLGAAALEDHGRLLLRAGRRPEGIARLTEAWSRYQRAGAQPAADGVRRTLRGVGAARVGAARVGEAALAGTGLGALSAAEHKVALLIGAGHTNRSAARRLGVSVNTVGSQLRAIFAKLEIQSRVQLANALHDDPYRPDPV